MEAIFPEDALPGKREPFVRINYAYGEGLWKVDVAIDEATSEAPETGLSLWIEERRS